MSNLSWNLFPLLQKCSVNGRVYGLGITEVGRNVLLRSGRELPPKVTPPPEDPTTQNVNFVDPEIWRVLRNREHPDRPVLEEFCFHLALNNLFH